MTAATDTFEQNLLDHIFLNAAITLIGDAAGLLPSAAAGNLYISLHTADPGEASNQTTSEATFTGYARVAVARTAAGWVREGSVIQNVGTVSWPQNTGSSQQVTHVGIGTSVSGTGKLLKRMPLSTPVTITNGMTFQLLGNEIAVSAA